MDTSTKSKKYPYNPSLTNGVVFKMLKKEKIPTIKDLSLENKSVFLRADLNVPLSDGDIFEDYKLCALQPTLDFLLAANTKIILATHLGRPKLDGEEYKYDKALSTQNLIPWFKKNGYDIEFIPDITTLFDQTQTQEIYEINKQKIVLLENLRFFKAEQNQDLDFTKKLKSLAQIYVNDAFALAHRNDTSVTLLPQLYATKNKAFGFLVEKELQNLNRLKNSPPQPFCMVCGGNKVKDKIPLLEAFICKEKSLRPTSIMIGGAMAYTFLKSQGIEVGNSLIEKESEPLAKKILELAQKNNVEIILPKDHVITFDDLSNKDFTTENCPTSSIPQKATGVDIGEKTIKLFCEKIKQASSVFVNGTMGIYTNPNSQSGTQEILEAIAKSESYSVIGGGDAVAATIKFDFENMISYLSTGGGATLKFLSLKSEKILAEIKQMPGLKTILE
jgi:phosphoglycerate kinase